MPIEIPAYKTMSQPVEMQSANLSQSAVNNFNQLLNGPSSVEKSVLEYMPDNNLTTNNNILTHVLHSISTLDLGIRTSSSNLRQAVSKHHNTLKSPNNQYESIHTDASTNSSRGSGDTLSDLSRELDRNLDKVKNLYKLQGQFHKQMTLFHLFSSLLTAFQGTLNKFLKM